MKEKPIVMVSSTARDLPEYRVHVMDACLRMDMFPKMMEHLPALDADAIRASLDLVNEADVYVGVFAHRYGYIPEGYEISITQMEYERAVERGIPRLIFLMHDDVPVLPKDYERGAGAEKLETLKDRLKKERVLEFFRNPEDLRGLVVHSLASVRAQLDASRTDEDGQPSARAVVESLHHIAEIPEPPEPYIAHPYTLLQVRGLVGRKSELEMLTDWVTGRPPFQDVRIFNVVAIGGMGKSALTWTWFNIVAPQEMTPLVGRIWWSFYESDATFENFVTRALSYVTRRPLHEAMRLPLHEREDQLLDALHRGSYLVVLDGLERILTAYARLDAAYLQDEDTIDDQTANQVDGADGFPTSIARPSVGKHKLRMAADPRAGRFLRELTRVNQSRILVSTRLYPADLQAPGGTPSPGCSALFLKGLSDQDALELWRAYGAKGSRDEMLPVFRTFDKHPLLLQLLAYEVADFRDAPGDFDAWKAANPDFNPFGMNLANVHSHVLAFALRGLTAAELRTLHVIAGFRMPASMETMKALLIRSGDSPNPGTKPFSTVEALDAALTTLEDRGLLGWDRRANRYDLHPIVRGVVWTGLNDNARLDLYGILRNHFETMPKIQSYLAVESLEDLTPALELYNTLIGLRLFDEAFEVFRDRLDGATFFRLGANQLRIELLERLFPEGPGAQPSLSKASARSYVLNALAQGYVFSGHPGAAVSAFVLADEIDVHENDRHGRAVGLSNLSDALRFSGKLRGAEAMALKALSFSRELKNVFEEGTNLHMVGVAMVARGELAKAMAVYQRMHSIWEESANQQAKGVSNSNLAEVHLLQRDARNAVLAADRAWELAAVLRNEQDFIRAARLQGTAALELGEYATASERLHHALNRARAVSRVSEELPTLVALAEWHRQQGDLLQARVVLEDLWDLAERGPYPLFHADALNVLAQIERDAGNTGAAVEAATRAFRLAWCDGPPFAYHWGLEEAKAHLAALGAPEPEMPPFDESQHEPMPEVEINPPDEFGSEE